MKQKAQLIELQDILKEHQVFIFTDTYAIEKLVKGCLVKIIMEDLNCSLEICDFGRLLGTSETFSSTINIIRLIKNVHLVGVKWYLTVVLVGFP